MGYEQTGTLPARKSTVEVGCEANQDCQRIQISEVVTLLAEFGDFCRICLRQVRKVDVLRDVINGRLGGQSSSTISSQ